MSDRWFKLVVVLLLLVTAVNTTLIAVQMPARIASAQDIGDLWVVASDILTHVSRISRGTCVNSRIC